MNAKLVKVAIVTRLVALLAAVVSMAVDGYDPVLAGLLVALALTSHLGLTSPRLLYVVVRHPSLALPDILLVFATMIIVGPDEPLAQVAVSSALLVGVLFPVRYSVLLCLLLVTGHVVAKHAAYPEAEIIAYLGVSVVLVSVTVMGSAFRRMSTHQQRLEELAAQARAAAAAADARTRMARDLHDTVAKSIQGVALAASALPTWIERDPRSAVAHAHHVATGARDAVDVARGMLITLRLDDPGRPLPEMLSRLVHRWSLGSPRYSLHVHEVPPLPPQARYELLVAVSEALDNVARHAPGADVRITLTTACDRVLVDVVDSGPGFDDGRRRAAEAAGHYGLVGMEERLASVGGRAAIDSQPGGGTRVRLSLPAGIAEPLLHRRAS